MDSFAGPLSASRKLKPINFWGYFSRIKHQKVFDRPKTTPLK